MPALTKEKRRNIEEHISKVLVRDSRIGFIERLNDNIALLQHYGENESLSLTK
nr:MULTISPECIES: spore germination protein [unclassified Bacillus (in: firmicutes)]